VRRKQSAAVVAASVLGLVLSVGIAASVGGGPAAAPAAAAAAPTPSPTDHSGAMFAAMMASHHQDGIKLTQMALDKSTNEGVRAVAQRSQQNQQAQLPQLRRIAQGGNMSPQPPEQPLARFNEQEMAELQELSGTEFDRKWLDTFSSHHMSAIMMADMEKDSSDTQVRDMARQIHDQQLQDITEMNNLRDQLG
jgi:uncharacterized protein (DUF305 family)